MVFQEVITQVVIPGGNNPGGFSGGNNPGGFPGGNNPGGFPGGNNPGGPGGIDPPGGGSGPGQLNMSTQSNDHSKISLMKLPSVSFAEYAWDGDSSTLCVQN